MKLGKLYQFAQAENIPIVPFALPQTGSLSLKNPDGSCVIAMDPGLRDGGAQEQTHLAHELGHCATGSFYSIYTAIDRRGRHENRADKWAIRRLITEAELDAAVAQGYTQLWELAEYFSVTQEFMKKTVCYYVHGNLATELYF